MIVAFLDEQLASKTLEPPKNAHVTVKKKFRLKGMSEESLIKLLKSELSLQGAKKVVTDASTEYDGPENMIVKIKNEGTWRSLHEQLLLLLDGQIESRDPHFEGKNYLPHITWRLRGVDNLDPAAIENRTFSVNHLYLIERIHPTKSIARVITKIPLES